MFSTLRYLAVISLILVLIGAVALGFYFRQLRANELLGSLLAHHQSIVAAYTDTVWKQFSTPGAAERPTAAIDFSNQSTLYFKNFQLFKLSVTSPDQKLIFFNSSPDTVLETSTDQASVSESPVGTTGMPTVRLMNNARTSANPNASKVLVHTVIPIFGPDITAAQRQACMQGTSSTPCKPLAVAEIYDDVTERWSQLQNQQIQFSGLIIGAFMLLGSALLYSTKRAESIIARQHELNLELTAAASRAEAESRDKSQFLASVSHELRTPLNAIIGFSEIVKTEARDQLQKIYLDYVEDICASGKHLLALINDILDFSKAEAGKLQIEWAETDVTKIIRNSLRMVLPRAETAQITLVEEIPNHHIVIFSDAKKLKQILLNLLSNAVKFTPSGGEVRCQLWEDVKTGAIMIQVRDTGIGIAPKDLSKVMTPFGQVDSALSRKYEGTGLGLPLAKAFLESMGGEFSIASELNVGTTVTLSLPKKPAQMPAVAPLEPEEEAHDVALEADHNAA